MRLGDQLAGGAFQTQALDEVVERLANHRLEDPVKVKRREARHPCDFGEGQLAIQVRLYVVHGDVDARDVLSAKRCRSSEPLFFASQPYPPRIRVLLVASANTQQPTVAC